MNQTTQRYQDRLLVVIDYIYNNLDKKLDLYSLADVAFISPYHLHRIYRGVYGETLAQTIQRLRLHIAADKLGSTQLSIEQIAAASGYNSVTSFTRLFKKHYGLPPATYRQVEKAHRFELRPRTIEHGDTTMYDVSFKSLDKTSVVGVNHTGSYMDVGKAFEKLMAILATNNALSSHTLSYGIYYDDPKSVEVEKLRSMACATVPEGTRLEGLETTTLGGGEFAVLRHVGPYSDLEKAYEWFYGVWLPQSGREPGEQPAFEHYVNDPRDAAPTDLITDIYMALK
ncbi:AraC family transcriptional regulator [Thaumasiovibrio subtropicus]|uniref:AraC family transcriptional regulator n=1 Tax=Thaumasiovibrio subtropicus TaxID=1891207 RepID=UPI000B351509|nr:AraC family transcriptional regulator [Thaumasiovibrio subtropicus]